METCERVCSHFRRHSSPPSPSSSGPPLRSRWHDTHFDQTTFFDERIFHVRSNNTAHVLIPCRQWIYHLTEYTYNLKCTFNNTPNNYNSFMFFNDKTYCLYGARFKPPAAVYCNKAEYSPMVPKSYGTFFFDQVIVRCV